jgi:long-chain acyl-CoA synthetase
MTPPTVRFIDRTVSHEDLKRRAAHVAGALHDLGFGDGARIAIVMRNDPDFLMLGAACGLLGAVPVPVNWHWRQEELRYVLSDSGAPIVFAHREFADTVEAVRPEDVLCVEVERLDEWADGHDPLDRPLESAPQSLIYTSGTTGLPKGVIRNAMTPEQSSRVAAATLEATGLRAGMSTIVTAPLYHAAPNAQGLFSVALGIDVTIMPRFDPEEFLRLVERHRITHAQLVPTMFIRLLELPAETRARYDIGSLQVMVHAAAPCPAHVKRKIIDWFGPIVLEYYGGTETGIVVKCDTAEWLAHEGTVGAPFEGAEIRVFDPAGTLLGVGDTGEIYVKPPSFWPGFTYVGQPERRLEMDRDGYLSIGDIGRVDQDGFLHLSDRARDVVISGGVNIYPIEIEACLLELDGVRDVAVFGIPDDAYGEALAAHIAVSEAVCLTEDLIRGHVRDRLAGYKVPRVVVFDDDLPRDDSGKIFKRRIRERYWRDAGRSI